MGAGTGARQALIVTAQPDAIKQALLYDLNCGVTVLEGHGGFTGTARGVFR